MAKMGIRRALWIDDGDKRPAGDLEPILFGWQRRGIALWRLRASAPTVVAAPFGLRRRFWPGRLAHAWRAAHLWLRPDDAYGMYLPHSSG
jgi:hypothetical protein